LDLATQTLGRLCAHGRDPRAALASICRFGRRRPPSPARSIAARRGHGGVRPSRARWIVQPRDSLQLGCHHRPRRRIAQSSSQVGAHQSGAHDLGPWRRVRSPCRRHASRPPGRSHLLGELHATGALRLVRPRCRDLHCPHMGQWGCLDHFDATPRPRSACVGPRQRHLHAGQRRAPRIPPSAPRSMRIRRSG
jgi:hypothetical protein